MDSLTITLNDLRQIDGLIYGANSAGLSVEDFALLILSREGSRFADSGLIGRETSAAFVQRFTATEYGAILDAAAAEPVEYDTFVYQDSVVFVDPENPTQDELDAQAAVDAANAVVAADEAAHRAEVDAANEQLALLKQYVEALTSVPYVHWDDPRLAPGLALLESAGLIAAGRAAEILTYERPTPEVV